MRLITIEKRLDKVNIIYFQTPLTPQEYSFIRKEFPQYHLIMNKEERASALSKQEWKRVEIFYGHKITQKEIDLAQQLHWIHSPSPFLHKICVDKIFENSNTLVTYTHLEQVQQVKEYMQAALLGFAKQIFNHKEKAPIIRMPWVLKNKVYLQVGLSVIGKILAKGASELGCDVWGVTQHRTLYESCNRVLSINELLESLPQADIVSLTFSPFVKNKFYFGKKEFEAMKNDSILIVLGTRKYIDEEELLEVAKTGKFRGIILDGFDFSPVPKNSPLRAEPNTLITTNLAPQPIHRHQLSFSTFCHNLRHFIKGNYSTMKNIVTEYQTE